MPSEIFGRSRELESIGYFLAATERDPRALVIEGEVGVGKSTLWLTGVDQAHVLGYQVLQARPAENEQRLSYSVLADLFSRVFDELRGSLPAPQDAALAAALLRDGATARANARTVGAAVVNLLGELTGHGRVLVAVDDIQWVDPASARALHFAMRRLPSHVAVLAAQRDTGAEHALGLDRALPESDVLRLVLGPISLAAVHHVILARLGVSLPRIWLTRLTDMSAGNPFFALEIARLLVGDLDDREVGDPLPVPGSLLSFVRERMGALSAPTYETVLTAAAMFRPTVAALTTAVPPELDVEAALTEAEQAGAIVIEHGKVLFAHPSFASVIYGSASEPRRRKVHARLAPLAADVEERARHLARGATEPDEATADAIEHGAKQAELRGSPDGAAELFEEAYRLTPADQQTVAARRLLGQATAMNALGDFEGARTSADRALGIAGPSGTRAKVLQLLGDLAWYRGAADEASRLLERALAEAHGDPDLTATLSAQRVRVEFAHDFERALMLAEAALPQLETCGEQGTLAHVLIDRFCAAALLGRPTDREALDRAISMEEAALRTGGQAPHPMPLILFHVMDEIDAARSRYEIEDAWYRDRGDDVWQADRRSHAAVAEFRAGQWDIAEAYAEEACAALEHVDVHGPLALVFEKRSLVDAGRGRFDRARATLAPLLERAERGGQSYWAALFLSSLAVVELTAGEYRAADDALTRMRRLSDSLGIADLLADRSEPLHIDALLAIGEFERARDTLARLEQRGRIRMRPWIAVTLPAARALVRAEAGHLADALHEFDDVDHAAPVPFELAWTTLIKGRLLRRARQKRAAADTLQEAVTRFAQLGATPWIARAKSELDRVGLRPPAPSELSESERRVAELVAQGFTNREVAARLFMSPKTVEANMRRIYDKLGVRSRAELGALLAPRQEATQQT
jgi:DNA-binding CsgD family transcriptional regulator